MFQSSSNISRFFGPETEPDFLEASSQMLENCVWEEESLKMISGHYKDGSPIPAGLLKNLIASRSAKGAYKTLWDVFLSTYDMFLHSRAKVDTATIAMDLFREILGVEIINGTNFGANFPHLSK